MQCRDLGILSLHFKNAHRQNPFLGSKIQSKPASGVWDMSSASQLVDRGQDQARLFLAGETDLPNSARLARNADPQLASRDCAADGCSASAERPPTAASKPPDSIVADEMNTCFNIHSHSFPIDGKTFQGRSSQGKIFMPSLPLQRVLFEKGFKNLFPF